MRGENGGELVNNEMDAAQLTLRQFTRWRAQSYTLHCAPLLEQLNYSHGVSILTRMSNF